MTISFNTSEMSSYSEDKAAYIMEAGDYVIRVGNSSRNTTPAAVLNLDEEAVTEQLKNNMSIDRDGKYPGGSSGEYDDLTVEENVSNFDKLAEEFKEQGASGKGLESPSTEGATQISLAAADFVTENPYEEKGVDGSGDTTVYVSATTDEDTAGTTAYDFALEKEYNINHVYFDKDGNETTEKPEEMADYSNATLKDVADGTITIEQYVSGLTVTQMSDLVEGGSKSPNANGQSSGGTSPSTADAGQKTAESAAGYGSTAQCHYGW